MSFRIQTFSTLLLCLALSGSLHAAAPAKSAPARADFRVPTRQYERAAGDLSIYIERSLAEGDQALSRNAHQKLQKNLQAILGVLPQGPAGRLKQLRFYLLWGENAPQGGRASGMSYIREGEPKNYPHLDPRWNNVIVIYSAKNLMYLDSVWAKKALMHELAHAWHILNWPEKYEPINSAYLGANARGLYRNVRDDKGRLIRDAYATRNALEYFAELSAMYFVGGNYFPFDRNGLAKYDSAGESMVRRLWTLTAHLQRDPTALAPLRWPAAIRAMHRV